MGFLSQYSGTDVIDLGDGYQITIKRHLPGDTLERAEAARVVAVAEAQTGGGDNKTVKINTTTNVADYTEALLVGAIVTWNLTDEYDQLLPLEPDEKKTESIRRLPAHVRALLRDKIEENVKAATRSPEDQKTFRSEGTVVSSVG